MGVKEIKHYIQGMNALQKGNVEEAENHLAKSLNVKEIPNYTRENIHGLMDLQNHNDAILTIVSKENKE